jgi:hypothetical protein
MLDVRSNQKPKSFILMLFLFSTLVIAEACTRSSDANNSVVTLAIPSARNASSKIESFAATEVPQHIVVKISGSGMSPVNYIWDGHGSTVAPAISLTVPQGPARLIQVLYVTQDPTQTLYFYYNDVTQDFTSGNVSVAMTVNSLSSSASQGQIVGKYLDSAGVGPTGILATVFQPPNGKPAMEVDRNEMFGGWFKAFALPSQAFNYVFEDGRIFFKDFVATSAAVTGQTNALFTQPSGFRKFGGNSNYDQTSAQNIVAGFFGPGATSSPHKICVNPSSSTVIPYLFTDTLGTTLSYNGTATCATANQSCLANGGDTADWSLGVCTSPDNISYVKFFESQLANRDSVMLFKGPFALTPTFYGASEANGNLSGSNLNLSWSFINGAAAAIDGVEIFYQWAASSYGEPPYKANNGYDCGHLVSNYGFLSAGRLPPTQTTLTNYNVGTGLSGQSLTAILCPYSKSRTPNYYSSAARWSGGSSTMSSATKIGLRVIDGFSTNYITMSACTPLRVVGYDNSNLPANFSNGIKATFDSGTQFIYLSNDCNSAPTSSATPTPIYNGQIIYYKNSGTALTSVNIGMPTLLNASGISVMPPLTLTWLAAPSPSVPTILAQVPTTALVLNACYPLNYVSSYLYSAGNLVVANTSASSFGTPVISGVSYYTDPICTTAASGSLPLSGTFPVTFYSLYFRYSGAPTSFNLGAITTATSAGAVNVNIVAPGTPVAVQTNFPSSIFVGSCYPINALSVDSNSNPSPSTASGSLAGSSGFSFFSDPSCTLGPTNSLSFSLSTTPSPAVFAKAQMVSPSANLSTAFASLYTSPLNIQINPLPAPMIIGIYSDPTAIVPSSCQPIMVTLEDSTNTAAPAQSTLTVTLTGSGTAAPLIYSDKACSVGPVSVTFNAGDTAKLLYYKASAPSSSGTLTSSNGATLVNMSLSITTGSGTNNSSATNNFVKGVTNSTHIKTGVCQPYLAYTYNSTSGQASQTTGAVSLVGPNNSPIFSDSACTNTTIPSFAAQQAMIIYTRALSPGGPFNFSGSIGANPSGGSNGIFVDP